MKLQVGSNEKCFGSQIEYVVVWLHYLRNTITVFRYDVMCNFLITSIDHVIFTALLFSLFSSKFIFFCTEWIVSGTQFTYSVEACMQYVWIEIGSTYKIDFSLLDLLEIENKAFPESNSDVFFLPRTRQSETIYSTSKEIFSYGS